VYVPSGTYCRTPFRAGSNPAYQTEFIIDPYPIFPSPFWVEIGTGHHGSQYWYADYENNSSGFCTLWYQTITTNTSHRVWIQGVNTPSGEYFKFYIDGTLEVIVVGDFGESYVMTGFESYSTQTTAAAYTNTSLTYATNLSTANCSCSDTKIFEDDSPLCVRVYSNTDVVAGENVSC